MVNKSRGLKLLIVVCLLAACLVAVLVYLNWRDRQDISVNQLPVIRIAVSQTPLSAPFFIASQLKLFAKQGLNVELVPCSGGVRCANALFAGDVDYATASESVAMFKSFERDDFVLLASFVSSDNDLKLLTVPNRGVETVSDLAGKRVGVVKASASEFYFDSVLIANGLRGLNVEKVYLSPDQLNQALFSFNVDAVSVWEPWGYRTEMTSASDVVNLGVVGIYNLSFNMMTMRATADSSQANSVALLQALKQAIQWIDTNPSQSRQWVANDLNVQLHQLEWSWQDYAFRLSLGNALLSNIQLQARWAIENKLVSGALPDYRGYFISEPLEQVLQTEVSFK